MALIYIHTQCDHQCLRSVKLYNTENIKLRMQNILYLKKNSRFVKLYLTTLHPPPFFSCTTINFHKVIEVLRRNNEMKPPPLQRIRNFMTFDFWEVPPLFFSSPSLSICFRRHCAETCKYISFLLSI